MSRRHIFAATMKMERTSELVRRGYTLAQAAKIIGHTESWLRRLIRRARASDDFWFRHSIRGIEEAERRRIESQTRTLGPGWGSASWQEHLATREGRKC